MIISVFVYRTSEIYIIDNVDYNELKSKYEDFEDVVEAYLEDEYGWHSSEINWMTSDDVTMKIIDANDKNKH